MIIPEFSMFPQIRQVCTLIAWRQGLFNVFTALSEQWLPIFFKDWNISFLELSKTTSTTYSLGFTCSVKLKTCKTETVITLHLPRQHKLDYLTCDNRVVLTNVCLLIPSHTQPMPSSLSHEDIKIHMKYSEERIIQSIIQLCFIFSQPTAAYVCCTMYILYSWVYIPFASRLPQSPFLSLFKCFIT